PRTPPRSYPSPPPSPTTTHTTPLSLHDALPICPISTETDITIRITIFSDAETVPFGKLLENSVKRNKVGKIKPIPKAYRLVPSTDRKSTRLNSSHVSISYAVFCLKTKNNSKRTS